MNNAPAGQWSPMTAPFALTKGARYAAAIQLSGAEKAFATPNAVVSKFAAAGFSDVTCTRDKTRVEGTWGLDDAPDVRLPSQVKQVWRWDVPAPVPTPTSDGTDGDAPVDEDSSDGGAT